MNRTHHLISLAGLALTAACAPQVVSSGSPAPTAPALGQWLRISSCPAHDCSRPYETHEGYLIGLEDDILVLHASGPKGRGYHLEVPTGWLTKIELYRGNKRTGTGVAKGAAKGAGLGAIGGAILGLAGSLFSEAFDFFDTQDSNVGESMVKGAAAGAATGAAVGAVDGAMNGEMQWEEITLDRVRVILCRQRRGESCPGPASAS
jgi:hypothetical protein